MAGIRQAGEPEAPESRRWGTVDVEGTPAGAGAAHEGGQGIKLVTAILGLELPEAEAKALLRKLKASSGTGGTLKEGVIELQGDQVAAAMAALEQEGFRPKQAGG